MKIRIVIVDSDKKYLDRLVRTLQEKYMQQLDISSFSEEALALKCLRESGADMILAEVKFQSLLEFRSSQTAFAYLTEFAATTYEGAYAICKYQKAESIFKEILGIFSEVGKAMTSTLLEERTKDTRVVPFYGIAGGSGASTMAVAFACHVARMGKRVLYLNLEKLPSTGVYFETQESGSFDDVIFALKSRKISLALKIESVVQRDENGIHYFSPGRNYVDILELSVEDIQNLIEGICSMRRYDYLVMDGDFSLDDKMHTVCKYASEIVLVSNGNSVCNKKMEAYIQSLHILEDRNDINLRGKFRIIYNKFRNHSGKILEIDGVKNAGGVPLIEEAEPRQLMEHVAGMDFWGRNWE